MRIGLLAVDSQYPNLALMKLSAYHKAEGDSVEWYNPIERYDRVYMAKVFTFTQDYGYYVNADKYGYRGEYFLYCILLDDFRESFNRVNHWRIRGKRFLPHAQPYRDLNNPRQLIPDWQRDLARWTDRKEIYRSCEFKDFEPRKGFKCEEYFNE